MHIANQGAVRHGRISNPARGTAFATVLFLLMALAAITFAPKAQATDTSPCGANINPVQCENSQTAGVTDSSTWDITDAGDSTIQGYSTDISVNAGGSIGFKIDTTLSYRIDIYRLGYYGGAGARLWASNVSHANPARQPACLTDPSTLLYDCGNWALSATWATPSNAVSGVYIARLTATNGDASHITFIVRNDSSTSDIVYQTSDPTWEAYNSYGGSDFYTGTAQIGNSQIRAYKISYNRPFATRGQTSGRDFLFSNEYPTIRFLERNGYDVSYVSGVDTDRYGATQLLKHKTFMSVGHDEYWSQAQRTNVENARDHGVNLMFLSGNEVYWHTRYEPSIDGSNTAYRTLVSYKETWSDAKVDPTPEWTGTWRDPRFASAPGGANPENGLTGTMFMSNSDDLAIAVTQAEGKMRLWRGTNLSSMSTGSTSLAAHTIGYESDEVVDNGFSPAGLIELSTTTGATPEYLRDFGSTVTPGTTTHHLTLYRAASGALVFGAGTIQWGWGLDQEHDGDNSTPPDSRIQQATVNMLADMQTLPHTLMAGLAAPTPSTDTAAPTVTITSPANNGAIANGSSVTVTGTAADNGGGIVAAIEVSLDGGTTWHPATGTTSWTYSGIMHGATATAIKVRATDDSANTSTPVSVSLNSSCPCSIFGNAVPSTVDGGDTSGVELGVRFSSTSDGYVTGIRFYKATANTGSHTGSLWSAAGALLSTGTFTNESASGWQTLQFVTPVAVTAGTTYVASYYAPNGHYSADSDAFWYKDKLASPLVAEATSPDRRKVNGVYSESHAFPSSTYHSANYYVDVQFSTSGAIPPSVTAQSPTPGASSIAVTVKPTATFNKAINPSTLTFTLKDPNNNTVAATASYDAASRTATLTPSASLAQGTLYTATVNASDTTGNPLPAPVTWNFRTVYSGQVGGACPCSLYPDSAVPTTATVQDSGSVELGVKFSSDVDGVVTGVRFYKGPQNTGIHTGSLWGPDGTQLATASFSNESSTGWQTVSFTQPVAITAGTVYTASYHTSVGYYSATNNAYGTSGLDNFPLHAPIHGASYTYASAYPNQTSDTDYGVDVVFTVPASVVPSATATTPANGDTNTGAAKVTATFNTSVLSGTSTFTVTPQGGSAVAGTTTLDSKQQVMTFTPTAALSQGVKYTATITGARSLSGTQQAAPITWSFTTAGGSGCPCQLFTSDTTPSTVDSGDASSVTLGVKIVPSAAGYITGVRFYKAAANTGVHTGSIWDSSGNRLSTVTFSGESASGWQSATFSAPVGVTAGSTYIVGYYTATGHYSANSHFFDTATVSGPLTAPAGVNGVYRYGSDAYPSDSYASTNYWVDAIFTNSTGTDTVPPSVSSFSPINGATSVSAAAVPSAVFSEAINSATLTMTLKDGSGTAVAGAVSYNATTFAASFTPTSALTRGAKYTVAVSAADTSGNAMAAAATSTFTVAQPTPQAGACPCSVWDDSTTPSILNDPDTRPIDVGMKFTASVAGKVTGVRFYKGSANTGTHTATLWTAAGAQLATGTYTGESSTGWQTLTFASGVQITANTTYVVSYHASTGSFSATSGMFASAGVDNDPLHVPAHAGLYLYGSGGFPANSSDSNYWVDPVFVPGSAPADTTAPVISNVAATISGSTATMTWTTDEPSSSRVDYGTSATSLTSSATSSDSGTTHSVTLTGLAATTRYYYRVTSVDPSGNSATTPASGSSAASVAPTSTPMTDAVPADFAAGTASSSYVAGNADAQVVLAPTYVAELTGAALPSTLTSTATVTGGKTTVAGGLATVTGARITTTAAYGNGKSIETLATLDKNQGFGWTTTSNANVVSSFTVNSGGQLVATVNDGFINSASSVISAIWVPAPHRFRIEWTTSAATFYLDDVQKYTHAFNTFYASTYHPVFADSLTTDTAMVIDWIRVGPYTATGTFTSRVFDAGASVSWDSLAWNATAPTASTLTVQVRVGNTPTPDASWTGYAAIPSSGGAISKTGRYLQYLVTMTSTGSRFVTPAFRSATATFHV
jgi:hypothetical protein